MNQCPLLLGTAIVALAAGISGCQSPDALRAERFSPPEVLVGHAEVESNEEGGSSDLETLSASPHTAGNRDIFRPDCGESWFEGSGGLSPRDAFRNDREDFFSMLARDAKGLVNWYDMALLGGALGGAIAIRQDVDDEVREFTEDHPDRWGKGSQALGWLGEVQYQVPVLLGVYGYSLQTENEDLHDLSRAMISAYTITGLSTLAVKGIADTDRPSPKWNDGNFGFPSFHTSSSFAIAAVVEEYQGTKAALPVYAVSGLVGWSRIDERDHDLSDVMFGAALGYVIGKSVARQHKERESEFRFVPYSHPLEPASGLAAEWRF